MSKFINSCLLASTILFTSSVMLATDSTAPAAATEDHTKMMTTETTHKDSTTDTKAKKAAKKHTKKTKTTKTTKTTEVDKTTAETDAHAHDHDVAAPEAKPAS